MSIDRWFIGGGAEHTPESARRLVYAATGGATGVCGSGDLKVLPLAVPGAGARVVIGSALISSEYVGGETQTYMGTVYEQELVTIVATGSGAIRSDLVVMRVEDPFAAGSPWSEPVDVATAPYVHIRVISGVPAGTIRLQDVPGYENDSAETLARVDLPVSTGTVTAGMIVDLRNIAQPRSTRAHDIATPASSTLSGAVEVAFPQATQQIKIPTWATEITSVVGLLGLLITANWVGVEFRLRLGTTIFSPVFGVTTDTASGGTERLDKTLLLRAAIPEAMRGTTQTLTILAKKTGGAGTIAANARTQINFDTELVEKP